MASDVSKIGFLISMDEDDSAMNNKQVIDILESAKAKYKLTYYFGQSKTKIQACNADIEKVNGWDILLLASDDMIPVIKGYDDIIRRDMNEYFRDTDGVLWYNDGGQNKINTLCVLGKRYYDRFNYVYNPEYISLWCDNEFTDISVQLKKVFKSDQVIIEHQHPVYQKTNYDELYIKNESFFNIDRVTYEKRAAINFGLTDNRPLFSILTPSVPERINTNLVTLCNKIKAQIGDKNVEHLVFIDNRKRSIGEKREALVKMANGKYLAFVDDDDDISPDYVDSIVSAVPKGVDVITFKQYCKVNDNPISIINFSINNKVNQDYTPGAYVNRIPFHVCAWKAEIAKKYSFSDKNYSEDWFWAQQLNKEAKTEYHIDRVIHTYAYSDNTTTTHINNQ